jgi:hypothetical protein
MKVATLVPEWVKDLVEHGIEPPLNTQAECDYVAWSFWDAAVPGLPPADSPEDREILRRAWERQERARQDAAARKGP